MRDPYQTLGVDRRASADDVKRAYRRLAAQHHPDRGGDTARFQEIQQAYDAITNPKPTQPQPDMGASPFGPGFGFGFGFDEFFNMFNQGQAHARRHHVKLTLWIDLRDVASGARRTVSVGTHLGMQAIDIDIPLAINDGDHVQYAGLAPGNQDLVVEFRVRPDAHWHRDGLDLVREHHVMIWDLMLGSRLRVTDILGQHLDAQIPAMTQPGTMLRLRGRGLRDRNNNQGDALVRVHAVLPESLHPDIASAIQTHRND